MDSTGPARLDECAGWAAQHVAVGIRDDEILAGFHFGGPSGCVDDLVMAAAEEGHIVDIGWTVISVVLKNVMGLAPDWFHGALGERTVPIPSDQGPPLRWGG